MKVGLNTEARPIENSLDRSLVTQSLLYRRSETFWVKSVAVNVVVSWLRRSVNYKDQVPRVLKGLPPHTVINPVWW